MESYVICDTNETLQGMRMAGILGEILSDKQKILLKIDELINNKEIGIVILTHTIKAGIEDEVMERKLKNRDTLIVEIPGPDGFIQKNFITKYIDDSIKVK